MWSMVRTAMKGLLAFLADCRYLVGGIRALSLCRRARWAISVGNTARASALAQEAISAEPDWPEGHYLLGYLYLRTDNLRRAKEVLEHAINTPGRSSAALLYLGMAESRLRNVVAAELAF